MKKFLPDLIAILAFIILSFAYFFPADIEGRILFQHDTAAGVGAGQESKEYLERTGQTRFLEVCLLIRCLRVTTRQRP
jgi:hypothetical protein